MQLHAWPSRFTISERLFNEGIINPKDRYNYQKISINGEDYFHKEARTNQVGYLLGNELLWAEFMEEFIAAHPDLKVRGLSVYAYREEESMITEFVDAPLLTTPDAVELIEPELDRYVQLLVELDRFAASYRPARQGKQTWTVYDQLDKGWSNWIGAGKLREKNVLSIDELEKAKSLVRGVITEARFQHGDFVPWHFFRQNDTWISFDAEHASALYPRFYDLVYSYTRFYTRGKNAALAKRLLTLFLQYSGMSKSELFAAVHPVIIARSIGVLLDAENDNQMLDYRREAKDLFIRNLEARSFDDIA